MVTYDAKAVGKSLDEAVEAWLADLRRQGRSDAYVYNMALLTRKLVRECRWSTLGSIRSDALTKWMASSAQSHLSGRSLNQYLDSARAFINWCCSHNPPWLPGNPLLGVEEADESKKRREKRALTLDELAKLKKVSGKRWVIYLTAALTGLRRSELRRLQWGDMHLDAAHPYIHLRAEATKAKRADVVPINPELLEALRAYRPAAALSSDAVFPIVPKYATFRKDVETRAGIPWRDGQGRLASFHALRKSFGTYSALANVPLRVAMDLMRMTEADMLTDIYTDAKLLNTSAAAARLPRIAKFDEDEKAAAG